MIITSQLFFFFLVSSFAQWQGSIPSPSGGRKEGKIILSTPSPVGCELYRVSLSSLHVCGLSLLSLRSYTSETAAQGESGAEAPFVKASLRILSFLT